MTLILLASPHEFGTQYRTLRLVRTDMLKLGGHFVTDTAS